MKHKNKIWNNHVFHIMHFMPYNDMLSEIKNFVKNKSNDIMLFIIVALLVMLSFAIGYIIAKYETKEPIRIIESTN